jgi:hypothetical protein
VSGDGKSPNTEAVGRRAAQLPRRGVKGAQFVNTSHCPLIFVGTCCELITHQFCGQTIDHMAGPGLCTGSDILWPSSQLAIKSWPLHESNRLNTNMRNSSMNGHRPLSMFQICEPVIDVASKNEPMMHVDLSLGGLNDKSSKYSTKTSL